MKNRIIQGVLVGLISASIAIALHYADLLQWLENPLWSVRAKALKQESVNTPKIKIVLIDQNSLNWGRESNGWPWPWPRTVHSAVAGFCTDGGAKSVTFDITFTENSEQGGIDDDLTLGAAIAESSNIVLACFSGHETGMFETWPEFAPPPPYTTEGLDTFTNSAARQTLVTEFADFPVPEIASNTAYFGNVFSASDKDGVLRRAYPSFVFDGKLLPALGLASYLAANPSDQITMSSRTVTVGSHVIPIDSKGRAILNFRGDIHTFPVVSAQGVIQSWMQMRDGEKPILDPAFFKDAYVFYGSSATGLGDLKTTPLARVFPGVGIHATFLDNLLSNDFIKEASVPHVFGMALICALLAGIVGRHCATGLQLSAAYILLVPLSIVPSFASYKLNIWEPASANITACILSLVAVSIVNYALEGKQKKFIKTAFRQYLSPIVIDKLLHSPENLKLGGEVRELSIYFSDIQGFTTISESLSAHDLTMLLNDYLSAMTDIILDEGGTVDKYEGDAIIAFWNAPVSQDDHPVRAVRASLRCQKKLDELRPGFRERINRDMFARIGLNTGEVVVGNMGSSKRFDYTFLGDAGNLAARLEGINKVFGTYLMISEYMKDQLGDEFRFREISRVLVVGKTIPVTVFEPYFPEDYEKERDRLVRFEQGLKLFYDGDFSAAITVFDGLRNIDPVATAYIRKCNQLLTDPPEEWDGVWQMTEK